MPDFYVPRKSKGYGVLVNYGGGEMSITWFDTPLQAVEYYETIETADKIIVKHTPTTVIDLDRAEASRPKPPKSE